MRARAEQQVENILTAAACVRASVRGSAAERARLFNLRWARLQQAALQAANGVEAWPRRARVFP